MAMVINGSGTISGLVPGGLPDASLTYSELEASIPQMFGMRNRIINGDMRIAQRGSTFSSGVGAFTYTLDRWIVAANSVAVSVSAGVDAVSPYISYLGITGAAGNTGVTIRQRIEWLNTADLAGQTVTVSFYCYKVGGSTTASVLLSYPSAKDNYTSVTSSATQPIDLSSTARQSFSFVVPAAGSNGIELQIATTAFTSGFFVLRGVQLEVGPTATPFERRPYGMELALCQRYYEVAGASAATVSGASGGNLVAHVSQSVTKRAAPTITRVADSYLYSAIGATGPTVYLVTALQVAAYRGCNGAAQQQQFSELLALSAEL